MKQPEIANLLIRIDERQVNMAADLEEVKKQTTATNGRVTSLESWRNRLKGAWAVLTIVGVLLGSLFGYAIKHFLG
jgi:hypothetical protein